MTTSKSKARGSAFERLVASYVGGKRTYSTGQHKDVGDVHTFVPHREKTADLSREWDLVTFETKDAAAQAWSQWLRETETERQNAGARYGFCVWKRRGKPVGESYVVMTLKQLMELLG